MRSKYLAEKPDYNKSVLNLSVSKVKTFKDCKAKYKYNYIDKLPVKDFDFFKFGKFLHKILEDFYNAKMEGDTKSDHDLLTMVWKKVFPEWKSQLSKEDKAKCIEICQDFIEKYQKDIRLNNKTLATEKQFYVNIDDKVLLNGFIDRVALDNDNVLHLMDWKTSKSKQEYKKDFFQLITYGFIMCLEDPSIEKVRVSYVMMRHGFEFITKEFSREEVFQAEETYLGYAAKIGEEKLFRPNPNFLCNYCSFLDICPEALKKLGKKVKEPIKIGKLDTW